MRAASIFAGLLSVSVALTGCAAVVPPAASSKSAVATATVRRGVVTSSNLVQGVLGYGMPTPIDAAGAGTLTALAAANSVVAAGAALFSVDNVPVFLMAGSIPAWRGFGVGMTPGPDVTQLLQNLKTLGYFAGTPAPAFTAAAAAAIGTWQKATGQTVTRMITFGSVVFGPAAVRIDSQKLVLGSQVQPGGTVLNITPPNRIVSVQLPLGNQGAVAVGNKVSIQLPDGSSAPGTVASVLAPAKSDDSATATVIVPVTITFDDPSTSAAFTQGSVTVTFSVTSHDGVFSVPVGALLAIGDNRFGVKAVTPKGTTSTIPVTLGLFGGGRVEISGPGVVDGLRVQVAG